jgi:hypothetical protein
MTIAWDSSGVWQFEVVRKKMSVRGIFFPAITQWNICPSFYRLHRQCAVYSLQRLAKYSASPQRKIEKQNHMNMSSKIAPAARSSSFITRSGAALLALIMIASFTLPGLAQGGRAGSTGVVYVISQGLYYDTFAAVDTLPMRGPFQLLVNGMTEFGPGDPGYLGGRWWEDLNANGEQDEDDHYFLCPLLGPGREVP